MQGITRPWLFGPTVSIETATQVVRVRCNSGHVFDAVLTSSVNIQTDGHLAAKLAEQGGILCPCPHCGIEVRSTLPVFITDLEKQRAALFLPSEISFMELSVRAQIMDHLLDAKSELPAFVGDFTTLVGTAGFSAWLEAKPASTSESSIRPDTAPIKAKKKTRSGESGSKNIESDPPRKSILDAFADLDGAEDSRRISIPPESIMDPDSEDIEDDWLDDDALSHGASGTKQGGPPEFNPLKGKE